MSSVKRLLLILILVIPFSRALAEGVAFTQSGDDVGDDTVSQLKQKAVVTYLQRQMGSRYATIAEQVTPEFAENYILDYQVGRKGRQTEVTGHLDSKSLMRWVRLSETKSHTGGAIRTALVITSEYPETPLSASDTSARIQDKPAGKILHQLAVDATQKFNVSLTAVDGRFPLSAPVRQESDMQSLRDFGASASVNTVLWVHLTPCQSCGGGKLNVYFYNLFQDRPAVVETRNVKVDGGQMASGGGLKEDLTAAFTDFSAKLEDVISSGTLSSRVYRVIVENIRTYKGFRQLQQEMTKVDFVARATLKRTEPFVAEYEVYSPMSAQDLSQRFQAMDAGAFQLQAVKADAGSVTLKLQQK